MGYGEANELTNKGIIQSVQDELGLNPIKDVIPRAVLPTIQPVYEINQNKSVVARSNTSSTSGSTTVYTTPTDKDFYLTSFVLSFVADASADNVSVNVTAFVEGNTASYNILRIAKASLTATNQVVSVVLPYPLKINRNTAIAVQSTFTVGTSTRTLSLYGYVEGQ